MLLCFSVRSRRVLSLKYDVIIELFFPCMGEEAASRRVVFFSPSFFHYYPPSSLVPYYARRTGAINHAGSCKVSSLKCGVIL